MEEEEGRREQQEEKKVVQDHATVCELRWCMLRASTTAELLLFPGWCYAVVSS
jgi:hypothetical protein